MTFFSKNYNKTAKMESRHKGLEKWTLVYVMPPLDQEATEHLLGPPNNAFISKTIKYPLHIHTPVGYYVKQV